MNPLTSASSILYLDLETTLDWKRIHCAVWQYAVRDKVSGKWRPDGQMLAALPGTPGWDAFKAHVASAKALSAHNAVGFDLVRLEEHGIPHKGKDILDTLVMACMLLPDNPEGHSAEALFPLVGKRKLKAPDFDTFDWERDKTYVYGDVDGGVALLCHLLNEMERLDFSALSLGLESRIVTKVKRIESAGFTLHMQRAQALLADLDDQCRKAKVDAEGLFYPNLVAINGHTKTVGTYINGEEMRALVASWPGMIHPEPSKKDSWRVVPINFNSRPQITERLLAAGWKPYRWTKKSLEAAAKAKDKSLRVPTLDDTVLEELESLGLQGGAALASWFGAVKYRGYVASWIAAADENNRVHCRIKPLGAPTGRMAHMNPNLAQVPKVSKTNPWGQRCRECFIPAPGKVLVGWDATGIEFKGLLHYAQDPAMILAAEGDIHMIHAQLLVDCKVPVWVPGVTTMVEMREYAKTTIYAWLFGAQEGRLGAIVGGDREVGAKVMRALLAKWPGIGKLIKKLEKYDKWVPALDGRMLFVRSAHAKLNTLLQGFGAIVCKTAVTLFMDKLAERGVPDWEVVAVVHDECQTECPTEYAELVARLGPESIAEAGRLLGVRVPLTGEAKIGDSWAACH